MGFNNNNRAWKENNKVTNWRMRCFKAVTTGKSLILKCTKAGKKLPDGSYPDPMFIDVIVTNTTSCIGDGVPEKKNILVSGGFQYSVFTTEAGNNLPQFSIFADEVKVDD